ncbi:MAG TPA: T9SS type A sorting domain-containing protein [Bacteroidia bacterium]|nr:T9SS type A sorting domain-containing protein [Bacteroidia bacterium]
MKKLILTLLTIFVYLNVYPWGNDILVSPQSTGKTSLVATASGTLYCSVPVGFTGLGGMNILQSTDMGLSWTPVTNLGSGQMVNKSKLVVTGTDSVYCAYQIGSDLFFYNLQSTNTTPFTTVTIEDFDLAASPNGNAIYLYTDDAGDNNIHRYSSTDGGSTWTGSTALVTGNGAHPRISLGGTTLILNYYGPVLADTATSIIRSAIYYESVPGNLTSSTFQDLVAAGPNRSQFATVVINGLVWFVFSEGPTLKYMLSTDDGASFGAETVVPVSAANTTGCFDITPFVNAVDAGMFLVYHSEGLPPQAQMMFTSVTTLSPTNFSGVEFFNDFNPQCSDASTYPSVYSIGGDAGVIWMETISAFPELYFDLRSAAVSTEELNAESFISIYPNPVKDKLYIQSTESDLGHQLAIRDLSGRTLQTRKIDTNIFSMDVSTFPNGIYLITLSNGKVVRFIKM